MQIGGGHVLDEKLETFALSGRSVGQRPGQFRPISSGLGTPVFYRRAPPLVR
jgi:hypothetical protein